jgi:hypothetical protein
MNSSHLQTRFELVFDAVGPKDLLPTAEIWQQIVCHLRHFKACPPRMNLKRINPKWERQYEDKLTPEQIHERLLNHDAASFYTDTNHRSSMFNIWLSVHPTDPQPSTLAIMATLGMKFPSAWNDLVESVAELYPIRIAHQYGFLYSRWQNMTRLDLWPDAWGLVPPYSRTTRTLPGVRTTLVWLDNSKNPGRSFEHEFNFYYVASEMWLGPGFWKYASCSKEEVLTADFFIEKRDTPHYLYLKSWPHPFTRPDGEQGRVQQKLWRLLYKQDCEWPPGSGGISDVPVGGPPELMP